MSPVEISSPGCDPISSLPSKFNAVNQRGGAELERIIRDSGEKVDIGRLARGFSSEPEAVSLETGASKKGREE